MFVRANLVDPVKHFSQWGMLGGSIKSVLLNVWLKQIQSEYLKWLQLISIALQHQATAG